MPAINANTVSRSADNLARTDTPPPAGKLGDHCFKANDLKNSARAAKSPKPPVPAPRRLILVNSQDAAPAAARDPAGSIASTPDSGLHSASPPSTPTGSYPASRHLAGDPLWRQADDQGSSRSRSSTRSDSSDARSDAPSNFPDSPDYPDRVNPFGDGMSVDSFDLDPAQDATSVGTDRSNAPSRGEPPPVAEPAVTIDMQASVQEERTGPHVDGATPPPGDTAPPLQRSTARRAPAGAGRIPPGAVPAVADGISHDRAQAPSRPPAVPAAARSPAVIASAYQHQDVNIAIQALRTALDQASVQTPVSSTRPARYTGARQLRAIARAQRHSTDALHHRALDFYQALVTLSRPGQYDGPSTSAQKRAALALAALAQRAAAEGYEAVDTDLIKRVLTPMLHSLPAETLCELGRLNDRSDGLGDTLLRDAGKLLGAGTRAQTPKAQQAAREREIASILLGVVAELAREHARAASWDRQVAAALEAARNGQHQQLDGALREMWQGELRTAKIDTPRVSRLKDLVGRLSEGQRHALATMLGATRPADATTATFDEFQAHRLAEFERDTVIQRQMLGFIDHLRTASRAAPQGGVNAGATSSRHRPDANTDATEYPEPITPPATFQATFQRVRDSVLSTFRRKPTTRDAAKAQINQAVRTLIAGDRLTADQLEALRSTSLQLNGKLGQARGTAFHGVLIQAQLSRLDPGQLAQLEINLAAARDKSRSSAEEDATLEAFYDTLQERLEREAGIRRGAAALGQVLAALRQPRHPEKLLSALDMLADAQYQAPARQSELDFCTDALGRLGDAARVTLQKHLQGRQDVQRHMRRIDDQVGYLPSAWLQYRRSQLETLAIAARAPA